MKELTITDFNGVETIDSRIIAETIEKRHDHLVRDIKKYCEYLTEPKIGVSDFFIESTYKDSTGRTLICYLCTRKGCEMIANKMTGQKGTVFTAMYINAFHSMENQLAETPKKVNTEFDEHIKKLEAQAKMNNSIARRINAENRRLKMLLDNPNLKDLSPESLASIAITKMADITGNQEFKNALPEIEKTYTATEIGDMLGISANKIGRIANKYNLKTPEYGKEVLDVAKHAKGKQVPTFRYNEKAVDKFKKILS